MVDKFCERARNDCLDALAIFMFATDARISEVLADEWENVNPPQRTALVPKSTIAEQRVVHESQNALPPSNL